MQTIGPPRIYPAFHDMDVPAIGQSSVTRRCRIMKSPKRFRTCKNICRNAQ